ncbi:MAG: hypothetical protein BWZ05_01901 [Bacteroidetes bacterium ADurb.BinA245]|nr:MAG: hypothetical protein BWZ05_01901 [Bacteroidetes bacterium ADurb.BinA245]
MLTAPLATPRLMDAAAPNSSEASICRMPFRSSSNPKNPPPPRQDTVRVKGCCLSQKRKPSVSGPPVKGRFTSAAIERLLSVNAPNCKLGNASVYPHFIPVSETSR